MVGQPVPPVLLTPEDKASGKVWDGAVDARHAFGDLYGHRPVRLVVHDAVDDTTAYRAELSARVDEPVLSNGPVPQLPDSWWTDLARAARDRLEQLAELEAVWPGLAHGNRIVHGDLRAVH
ncbi:hypothetical protein PV735_46200 [Streptomyces turgidiscabies]|uniref:Aminoglycoside phosphotransferase domain-containing protein n=1 Tax=Streptomyces turgidiscabies (strain Car8) TaxID=698760 RepID=L7F2Z7_STRT8|nr:hypothetical protein [Streptomyces turgidiscabies]ELP65988.1 hypothetical protein STRTUCAR8_01758 [Streptomyces turgidiscabies Car8]MDX3500015.1 hypothetical protein [Streptomyces turgidiscabies]